MSERYDVVIVGARCAGAPLATLLAREGVKVAVVEQATFPRDTLSTHIFESDALAFLDRLGLSGRLRATGAPFLRRTDTRMGDLRFVADWPQEPGDVGGIAAVRRMVLDAILAEAAEESGADVRMGARAIGLLEKGGRVAGVRVAADRREEELEAPLVVGADGRASTIGRLCGARKYNLTPNRRALYYTYFEGADLRPEPTFVFHRWADRMVLACPTDDGLYLVLVLPDLAEIDRFRSELDASFMAHATSCEPVAAALAGTRRVGKHFGIVRWAGYFREAAGRGWVLVGDAGHFKDPAAGRGIGDAFSQADALAPAIVAGLSGTEEDLDRALADWGRWRDDEFAQYYWYGTDLGRDGPVPAIVPELARVLLEQGKGDLLLNLQSHRAKPSRVLSPPRVARALGRVVLKGGERRRAMSEVVQFGAEDFRRRRLDRHPVYAPEDPAPDDRLSTEVDDRQAVAQP